jgi:ribosomal protein L24
MSKINFFEKFAKMSINGGNGETINNITKKMNDLNVKCSKNEEKEIMFKHSSHIILTKGQYKGYSGFVYEYYPSRLFIEIKEVIYVPKRVYGDRSIGEKVDVFCTIINTVDEMYGIMVSNEENSIDEEIRIFKDLCLRIVFMYINDIKRISIVIETGGKTTLKVLEIGVINSEFTKLMELSNIVKQNKLNDIQFELKNVTGNEIIYDEYYMITSASRNCENNYTGKFGKLSRVIEEQYILESKKNVFVMKNMVEIKADDEVYIKKGIYKDKIGKILKFEEASMKLNIEPLGRMIYSHVIKQNDIYVDKKITKEDVFYKDLILKDNNYFQISKVKGAKIYGTVLCNNRFKECVINKSEIKMYMPGCKIENLINVKSKEALNTDEDISGERNDIIFETSEVEEEIKDEDDMPEQNDYDSYQENDILQSDNSEVVMIEHIEMKNSFKDIERIDYLTTKLKKEEKDIMKYAFKILEILGYSTDIINVYELINDVIIIKNKIEKELRSLDINEWKETDLKYIIMNVLCYNIMKVGFSITTTMFNSYIAKLLNKKFFMKSQILGSVFLREFITEDKGRFINVMSMSKEDKENLNVMYKSGDYCGVIRIMLNNCNLLLKEIFNEVVFIDESYKIEYIPVCKPKTIKEYPKFFMTSNEIVLGLEIPETANKIIWNPETMKIMKRLKSALVLKSKNEQNDTLKIVYKFVIDNIENAPFVLKNYISNSKLNSIDELKFKELKRTFEMFTNKINVLLEEKARLRNIKIESLKEEKETINQKRKKYIDNRSLEEIELSMKQMMERNVNILKRIKL